MAAALLVTGCVGDDSHGARATGAGDAPPSEAPTSSGSDAGADSSSGAAAEGDARTPVPSAGTDGLEEGYEDVLATREKAARFARRVVAKPIAWGTGYVKDKPYKSGPDRTSVLGEDCTWRRGRLRGDQLASVTRRSRLPARDGKGVLEVSAVVIVYRDVDSARWAMARTLEDTLRCPEQRVSRTQRITELASLAVPRGSGDATGDDATDENGLIHRPGDDSGPHPYSWSQSRLGPVVMCATVKGARGYGRDVVEDVGPKAVAYMVAKARVELGVAR